MTVSGPFSQWWQSGGRQVESEVRGQSWPSPQDLPAHWAWANGRAGCTGNRLGVSCRAPEPLPRLPTGWTQALRHRWNFPPLGLWDLIAEAVHLGHSLWDLPPMFGWPEEPEGHLGPGCLAPSVMMAGQGLRIWPFSSVQFSCSVMSDSATPWIAAHQASLSITNSRISPKFICIESVMPSSHLILCCPLLLLPPIPPSIRVFSNESNLHMRWPKYWSFSLSISPSNEHPGLISFRMDWLYLLAVQGTLTFRELPIEICLLLARIGHPEGESYTWEPCPFLSEQNNTCFGEIYRNIITWPWPDLKNKGPDTLKLTTNHVPPSRFLGKGFAESCQEFGVFKAWSTHLPAWPSINLYLFQTPMFWYCLASLCDGHMDLSFSNTMCLSDPQWSSLADFPSVPRDASPNWAPCEVSHRLWSWSPPWALSLPLAEPRPRLAISLPQGVLCRVVSGKVAVVGG